MAEKLDPKETVTFKELLIADMIETQTIVELLFEKGIITKQEYFNKLKQVQSEYQKNEQI